MRFTVHLIRLENTTFKDLIKIFQFIKKGKCFLRIAFEGTK